MQENPKNLSNGGISLEILLQLKRLEKPGPEFWDRFDRDLEQRRLKALVKPRPSARWLSLFRGKHPVLASMGAAVCVTLLAIFWMVPSDLVLEEAEPLLGHWAEFSPAPAMGNHEYPAAHGVLATTVPADHSIAVAAREASPASAQVTESLYVLDTMGAFLSSSERQSFQTNARPKTLVAAREDNSHYVLDSLVRGNHPLPGTVGRLLQF